MGFLNGLQYMLIHYKKRNVSFTAAIFFFQLLIVVSLITACKAKTPTTVEKSTTNQQEEINKLKRAFVQINAIKPLIQNGDLITRTGADFTSESLRSLNQRDQTYSHCGIISIENDSILVYHALGGDFNPDQKILRQPMEVFAQPGDNRGIGVFRFNISNTLKSDVIAMTQKLYRQGIMFDMKFDLASDDHMYCAEFVYKSFSWGTHAQLQFTTSHIRDFAFVGVDDIFLHPLCHLEKRIVYN